MADEFTDHEYLLEEDIDEIVHTREGDELCLRAEALKRYWSGCEMQLTHTDTDGS